MPVAPRGVSLHCPRCDWQGRWQPSSDALRWNDLPPERCPRCGADALDSAPMPAPSRLQRVWDTLRRAGGARSTR